MEDEKNTINKSPHDEMEEDEPREIRREKFVNEKPQEEEYLQTDDFDDRRNRRYVSRDYYPRDYRRPMRGYYGRRDYRGSRRYQQNFGRLRKRRRDSSPLYDDKRYKRRKTEEDEKEKYVDELHTLITIVGDKEPNSITKRLEGLTTALINDIPNHSTQILEVLMQCIMELSVKTPIYGTLVALVNLQAPDFGKKVIEETCNKLKENFVQGNWMTCKLLVRFICELLNANVVLPEDVIQLLQNIMKCTTLYSDQAISDYYAYIVIAALPWAGRALDDRKREELNKLVADIEDYMKQRNKKYIPLLKSFVQQKDDEDYLDVMWSQLKSCKEQDWRVTSILKPYITLESKLSPTCTSFEALKDFQVPQLSPEIQVVPLCKGRIGLCEFIEEYQKLDPIDAFVMEEYICDILYFFHVSPKDCVKQLLNIPVKFQYEYLLVDVLFSNMLLLPESPFRNLYYASILTDLCKIEKPLMTPIIARFIDLIFEKSNEFDQECIDRFINWFAFHMNQFDFVWIYSSWNELVQDKKILLQDVVYEMLKLTFYDHIKNIIPQSLESILPPNPVPNYPYEDEKHEYNKQAKSIIEIIKSKIGNNELSAALREMENINQEGKFELLLNTILFMGSKSQSHTIRIVDNYIESLKEYKNANVVQIVADFWKNSPQQFWLTIETLMSKNIIDVTSLIGFLFSNKNIHQFERKYYRDFCRNIIQYVLYKSHVAFTEFQKAKLNHESKSKEEENKEEKKEEETEQQKEEKKEEKEEKEKIDEVKEKENEYKQALRELRETFGHLYRSIINSIKESQDYSKYLIGYLKEFIRKYRLYLPPDFEKIEGEQEVLQILNLSKELPSYDTNPAMQSHPFYGKLDFILKDLAKEDSDSD